MLWYLPDVLSKGRQVRAGNRVGTSQSELGVALRYPVLDRAIKFHISHDFASLIMIYLFRTTYGKLLQS